MVAEILQRYTGWTVLSILKKCQILKNPAGSTCAKIVVSIPGLKSFECYVI
jgi:hypothetical protein